MTETATSNDAPVASTSASREAQLDKLDELWEQYLSWLDEYQKTRQQISQAFASGFMSLAQANFSNSARTRYGRDYYDERMQAVRKVVIEPADEPWLFEVVKQKGKGTDGSSAVPDSEGKDSRTESEDDNPDNSKLTDSIRWFGMFTPQALRDTQAYFTKAVEGPVPRLATITRQLRNLEVEISRLKKNLKKLG